jgi:hypothetical protein
VAGNRFHIIPLLVITLVSVSMVESGYLALEYFVFRQQAGVAPIDTVQQSEAETGVDVVQVSDDYQIILRRNLFGKLPDEGFPLEETPVDLVETQTKIELNLVLVGTVGGDNPRAFILDKGNSQQQVYEVGDVVQGALIKEISRGQVSLSINDREEVLDLSEAAQVRPKWQGKIDSGWAEPLQQGEKGQVLPGMDPSAATGDPGQAPGSPEMIDGERVRSRLVRLARPPGPSGSDVQVDEIRIEDSRR